MSTWATELSRLRKRHLQIPLILNLAERRPTPRCRRRSVWILSQSHRLSVIRPNNWTRPWNLSQALTVSSKQTRKTKQTNKEKPPRGPFVLFKSVDANVDRTIRIVSYIVVLVLSASLTSCRTLSSPLTYTHTQHHYRNCLLDELLVAVRRWINGRYGRSVSVGSYCLSPRPMLSPVPLLMPLIPLSPLSLSLLNTFFSLEFVCRALSPTLPPPARCPRYGCSCHFSFFLFFVVVVAAAVVIRFFFVVAAFASPSSVHSLPLPLLSRVRVLPRAHIWTWISSVRSAPPLALVQSSHTFRPLCSGFFNHFSFLGERFSVLYAS